MVDLQSNLAALYGDKEAPQILQRIQDLITRYQPKISAGDPQLTEGDVILITYGDQVSAPAERPLQSLRRFCRKELATFVNGIHILPFFPSTSDDGFSVVDYRQVDPLLGNWDDVSALAADFKLMFDGVINHVSTKSAWFDAFLRDDPAYREYFIVVAGSPDLSRVVRPRALPLLTSVTTLAGVRSVWTTFSSDQVDLNFREPQVLLDILDVLLMYAERGASFLRLDAVAYLWKEIGTSCIHLPQCHQLIQILRGVLDQAAPAVNLITETNVPHPDNISYFGDGSNEAQLVYNFALPPLTLHALHTADARTLSQWAATLTLPSRTTTFFNFLASHDGIGLNPARGFLSNAEIDGLVDQTLLHGGLISYKDDLDGRRSPYEMNINFFDALSNPAGDEPLELQVDRFIVAQAIMLALIGVPGIYFHSLFGSRGWPLGVSQTGRYRTINREKCDLAALEAELADPRSLRSRVFTRFCRLLVVRKSSAAFDPHGVQRILDLHPSVFAIERISGQTESKVLCLHNLSARTVNLHLPFDLRIDLVSRTSIGPGEATLAPYQVVWASE